MKQVILYFSLAIVFLVIGFFSLRYNRNKALELRDLVMTRDLNSQVVEADLEVLKSYVNKHMNSSVKLVLSGSYERAQTAALAGNQATESGQLYTEAQAHCDQIGVSSVAQAQCVIDYMEARRQPGQNPTETNLPDINDYTYNLKSPRLTADLAGISLLLAVVLSIISFLAYLMGFARRRI